MNSALAHSELNFNFRLFCKTVSKSPNWGFDRFRLFNPKWHTKVQVRKQDGSIVATQDFSSVQGFEHNFSFDLSGNINNEEYSVYIAGVPEGAAFNQAYAYPTGYSATTGKNAELTFWDFSQVNVIFSGTTGRIRFENNPIYSIEGALLLQASEVNFANCSLGGEMLADMLIGLDNSGVLNGSFNYSGNNNAPAERALTAYNNLKNNKGWVITGEIPANVPQYESEVSAFSTDSGVIDEAQLNALDIGIKYWKSQGVWADVIAIHPMLGTTAAQRGYNAKNTAAFYMNFYGSWTFTSAGNVGASNVYATFGFAPSTGWANGIGVSTVQTVKGGTGSAVGGSELLYLTSNQAADKSRWMPNAYNAAYEVSHPSGIGIFTGLNFNNTWQLHINQVTKFSAATTSTKPATLWYYGAIIYNNTLSFSNTGTMSSQIIFNATSEAQGKAIAEGQRRMEVALGRLAA